MRQDNDSRETKVKPVLLIELIALVSQCQVVYQQQRVGLRALALVMAELMAFGRHTITQLLMALGLTEEDWSPWYRLFSQERYDEAQTSRVMLREMLAEVPADEPFVVGVDGFHVPRVSQKMPGTAWMRGLTTARFNPGTQRGQRFVEGSWLTPRVNGYSRAIPIRCLSAFSQKSVPGSDGPRSEVSAGLDFLSWTRAEMDAAGRQEQRLVALHDGRYDTLQFWSELPERTVGIARTARNRCLYELPPAGAHGNCKYGDKALSPAAWLRQRTGFRYTEVVVRGRVRRMRYRVEGPFVRDGLPHIPLFLIVVGGGKRPKGSRRKTYQPCFFLVSAVPLECVCSLPLPLADLLA